MNKIILSIFAVMLLAGCEGKPADRLQSSIDTTPTPSAVFDPSAKAIPFPDNLLFQGKIDGTLNIPVADPADFSDPKVAMNTLNGFSTVAPITANFNSPIDSATIPGNVRVFEVQTDATKSAITSVDSELLPYNGSSGDFVATVSSQTTLVISPVHPLKEETAYAVVVTSGLKNTSGVSFLPSAIYSVTKQSASLLTSNTLLTSELSSEDLQSLEGLRAATVNNETQIEGNASPAISSGDIILSWVFTTQSIGNVLAAERSSIASSFDPNPSFIPGAFPTGSAFGPSPGSLANIYQGTIDVPYFQAVAGNINDPSPLVSYWKKSDDSPVGSSGTPVGVTKTIPVMVSVPTGASLDGGSIPVVIYQHGITTNRTTMLAIADQMASKGFAVVAIDLPLHGVTGNESDGTQNFHTSNELTFDLDLVTQDSSGAITAATPDGITDSSGRHFIQLASLLTSRDNLRQAVVDLFALTKSIGSMDVNGGGADFDASNVYFVGHSLGGIVGVPFLALEPNVKDGLIAMAGGGIPKILDGSATFGPEIASGLAANGVTKGTSDYEAFMGAAQTVVDTVDPINFANGLMGNIATTTGPGNGAAISGRGLLMYEVVGGSGSPSDLVIPNTVPDSNDTSGTVTAPLAGTEPLATMMGLTQATSSQTGTNLKSIVKFSGGHHGSLLTSQNITGNSTVSSSAQVFAEMQSIMGTYINSDGANVTITDSSVIAP